MAAQGSPPAAEPRTREASERMGRTMRSVREETGQALRNIDSLPPYETLQVIGGLIALGLGTLLFFFGVAGVAVFGPAIAGLAVFWWVMNLIFGFLVLMAFGMFRRSPLNGAILGLIFGLLLAIFGGASGLIGGILAMAGFAWGYWVESGGKLPTARPPAA
jgi:hypothetical protein